MNVEPSFAVGAVEQNFSTAQDRISGTSLLDIDGTAPPFLIVHGRQDQFVSIAQSVKLAQLLIDAGHTPLLAIIEDAGHGFVPRGGEPTPSLSQITALMVGHFKDQL